MAVYIGVDLHTKSETVCWLDTADGSMEETRLEHDDLEKVRGFYRGFKNAVVGVESVGYAGWFHRLVEGLGHQLLVGDAAAIRARAKRRQKNDRRDAALLLELLWKGEFPAVHRPGEKSRVVLGLLRYRQRLVKMRTMLKNGVQAVALNEGLRLQSRLWTQKGQAQLAALELDAAEALQREESLALLSEVEQRITRVERELAGLAEGDRAVELARSHPGVGLLTSLAVVHTLQPVARFRRTRKVAAYLGYDPQEDSSGERRRYGRISKQGSRLLRYLLGEAAVSACRHDDELRSFYLRLQRHKQKPAAVAVTAVARKLAIRLYVLLRDQIDYDEFRRRGRDARCARDKRRSAPAVPVL
jgi:transposase